MKPEKDLQQSNIDLPGETKYGLRACNEKL